MIRGVIFDLDGVILSTDDFHYLAWKRLADSLEIPFDRKKNDRLRGVSRMASLDIVLEGHEYSEETKLEFAERKNNTYRELLATLTPEVVDPSVIEALNGLKEKGIRIAIGSSSKNTKFILEKVHLLDAFDAISDGTNITRSKPDPEVFLKASEMLGLSPEECMVVEDAEAGIDAANAGGFTSVAIGPAKRYAPAKERIDKLTDLFALLEQ